MEQPVGLTCVRGGHHWGDDCLRPRPRPRPGPRPGFLQLCGGRGAPNQQASALPRFFSRFVLRPRKWGGGAGLEAAGLRTIQHYRGLRRGEWIFVILIPCLRFPSCKVKTRVNKDQLLEG